jgi:hypothetical protein
LQTSTTEKNEKTGDNRLKYYGTYLHLFFQFFIILINNIL